MFVQIRFEKKSTILNPNTVQEREEKTLMPPRTAKRTTQKGQSETTKIVKGPAHLMWWLQFQTHQLKLVGLIMNIRFVRMTL